MRVHARGAAAAPRRRLSRRLLAVGVGAVLAGGATPSTADAVIFDGNCVAQANLGCGYFDQYRRWFYFRVYQENFSENQRTLCSLAVKSDNTLKNGSSCEYAPPNHRVAAWFSSPDIQSKAYGLWEGSGSGRRLYLHGCTDNYPSLCDENG